MSLLNKTLVILILISFFNLNFTHAQQSCRDLFSLSSLPSKNLDKFLFNEKKAEFEKALDTLKPEEQTAVKHILNSLYFFDYLHIGPDFVEAFLNPKKTFKDINLRTRYDKDTTSKEVDTAPHLKKLGPYDNFETLMALTQNKKFPLEYRTLQFIHKTLMRDGVEGIKSENLGVTRELPVTGKASGIKESDVELINSNIYLKFEGVSDFYFKTYFGKILYPGNGKLKPEVVKRIRTINPKLADQIETIQKESKSNDLFNNKLIREIVETLITERIEHYKYIRERLGPSINEKNIKKLIYLIADLQLDLISIHPFTDGNGRSIRAFTNLLLIQEGLPPSYIINPASDIQTPKRIWRKLFYDGVIASSNLITDLTSRIQSQLPIENSAHLLYPLIKNQIEVDLKAYNKPKPVPKQRETEIDQVQFSAFIKAKIDKSPELMNKIKNNPLKVMSELAEEFIAFMQKKTIDYIHNKEGLQEVKLSFADPDFISMFGTKLSNNPKMWNLKIDRNYKRQILWRGMSQRMFNFSDAELLSYFSKFNSQLLSNRVAKIWTSSTNQLIRELVLDFETYNSDLLSGQYIQLAKDHQATGPLYKSSYGLSASKKEAVGKGFAMGAMVIAPYGKQNTPELQAKLKSRINIGFYRANKDVDLGRLHQIDESFSSKYPRQVEVMVVGGVEPDAVMIVQRINADGSVSHTFARDLQNPNIVHIISGRWVYEDGALPQDRIISSHKIIN